MAHRKPWVEKICPTCMVHFSVKPSVADVRRCCSVKCQGLWKRRTRVERICKTCSAKFEARPSDFTKGSASYCSRKCLGPMYSAIHHGNKYRKGLPPWNAGKKGTPSNRKGVPQYHIRGENNPNWKGGTRSERSQAMTRIEYKAWRDSVFHRDDYTCQVCDQYGGVLHADHIKSWSEYKDLRYDVNNGRTLCVPCHYYVTFKRKMPDGKIWCNFKMTRKRG